MLDLGLLVYGALLLLAIWRKLFDYWCCGLWLSILNYMSLLYLLLASALAYLLVGFYQVVQLPEILNPSDSSQVAEVKELWSVKWLRGFVLFAPIAATMTVILGWLQTDSHVFEIHKKFAMVKHDRAVQIVALPGVYGVMALASMMPVIELSTGRITSDMLRSPWYDSNSPFFTQTVVPSSSAGAEEPVSWKDAKILAIWRYETCLYVADLFEAWALFQFSKLVLEQVREAIACQDKEEATEVDASQRLVEKDLQDSHSAVTSLTWVGTSLFVACCVAQSAASIWPYLGGTRSDQELLMQHLSVAGFVASCAAIYNLVVVEQAFHRHLTHLNPLMKFLTVKFLVSICFLQKTVVEGLEYANNLMPETMKSVVHRVPFIGDIVHLSELQQHLFYPALVMYECFILAILHLFVWKANESWYKTTRPTLDLNYTENDPMLLCKPYYDEELAPATSSTSSK